MIDVVAAVESITQSVVLATLRIYGLSIVNVVAGGEEAPMLWIFTLCTITRDRFMEETPSHFK